MGVWFDSSGDVMLTACSIQQGVVVEQTAHICPFHTGQNVFGHVVVKRLRVTLQSVKQAEGLASSLDILSGKTGGGKKEGQEQKQKKTKSQA